MAKQATCKIESGPQARKAIGEIRVKTQWPIRRIAAEAGLNQETLRKVWQEITTNPGLEVRQAIAKLAVRVGAMK